jgi:hypothetical protein
LNSRDTAEEAYDKAKKFCIDSFSEDECKQIWLRDKIDVEQVQKAVLAAKEKYEAKSAQSKARKWLTKLFARIMFYSKVLDALANYNPEYVALAWGAMKFLLTVRCDCWISSLRRVLNSITGCYQPRRANYSAG